LGSHPATGDSPQRRGHGGFPDAADSTTLLEETQVEWYLEDCFAPVVEEALIETQKKIGRRKREEVCRAGPWYLDLARGKTFNVPCHRKACSICRRELAKRFVKQIEYENVSRYATVQNEKWNTYRKTLERKEFRYKRFPVNGNIVVVSDMGDTELPGDLTEFLDDTIVETQGRGRITGTHKFGGKWSGHRDVKKTKSHRYWRPPHFKWSITDVIVDVGIALGNKEWQLTPYTSNDGFALLGSWDNIVYTLELAGIVGAGGQVVW